MSVLESARRLCNAKTSEPSASPDVIHELEISPFRIGVDTFGTGRRWTSAMARRASDMPVLLNPPVLSFTNGHTESPSAVEKENNDENATGIV